MAVESTRLASGRTLFVRNLPYGTSDRELESAFCECGLLKACFTVKEKGVVDRCRGFGYVTFGTREDAERAKSVVKVIGGRPVQLSFATRKPPRKKTKKEGQEGKQKEGQEGEQEGGGGEAHATRKPLREGKRKGAGKEEACEVDNTLRSDGETGEEESEDDYETRTAQTGGGSVKGHHKPRSQRGKARFDVGRTIVLTHLPENASEKGLRKKCMKVGTVENVQFPVPKREVSTAFVTFKSYKDARHAVEALNGATHRGTTLTAVLLSREIKPVSRETLKKSRLIVRNLSFQCSEEEVRTLFSAFGEVVEVHIPRKPNGHMLGYAFVQFTSYFSAKKAVEGMNAKKIRGRPVAVDWVVPKEKYELALEGKGRDREERGGQDGGVEDRGEESDGLSDQSLKERKEELEMKEGHSDGSGRAVSGEEGDGSDSEDDEFSEEEEEEEEEEECGRKNFKEDVHEGKTIFVRNVPVDVDEGELRQAFVQFGGVRYCRLVSDPNTGIARGSAFVQFYDHAAAHQCLEAANVGSQQGLHLHGRQLDVSLALSKKDTERLNEQKSSRREKIDKRNLHLAREGVILPDSEAAKDLSKADIAKRMKAYREKKAKLANPNFFISQTRLSVRNLPTQVDEKQLKSLFLKAAGGAPAMIKQVKILRSAERVDGKGVARSKGFAFVEFSSHGAALIALRATNNNPELLASKKRLIVEFALEDSRALKLREQRHKRQLVSKKSPSSGGKPEAKSNEDDGLSKKEKWRLKRQAQRLRKKQSRESQSEQERTLKESASTSSMNSQLAVRTALDSDALTTRTLTKRHESTLSTVGTKRKARAQERPEFAAKKRRRTSEETSVSRNQQPAARRMNPKKMKSRKAEDKEEAEFAQMVAKYKRKLLGTASDSRWFE